MWRANLKEKYSSIRIICCYHEQFYGKYFERKIISTLLKHSGKVKKVL